jgi:hypothetical protein
MLLNTRRQANSTITYYSVQTTEFYVVKFFGWVTKVRYKGCLSGSNVRSLTTVGLAVRTFAGRQGLTRVFHFISREKQDLRMGGKDQLTSTSSALSRPAVSIDTGG